MKPYYNLNIDWNLDKSSIHCGNINICLNEALKSQFHHADISMTCSGYKPIDFASIMRDEMYDYMGKYKDFGATGIETKKVLIKTICEILELPHSALTI